MYYKKYEKMYILQPAVNRDRFGMVHHFPIFL